MRLGSSFILSFIAGRFHCNQQNSRRSTMWLAKTHCPPAERNKEFIWEALQENIFTQLADCKWNVLEVAAGSGCHTAHFVTQMVESNHSFHWEATDPEQSARESQLAYIEELSEEARSKVSKSPLSLTLSSDGIIEPETRALIQPSSLDLIVNCNMIHISPWEATLGLMKLAGENLKQGGFLYLYGPYKQNGTAVASNLKFDQFLKAKDPSFGVRNLEDVLQVAETNGLDLVRIISMPANNLSVILRRRQM